MADIDAEGRRLQQREDLYRKTGTLNETAQRNLARQRQRLDQQQQAQAQQQVQQSTSQASVPQQLSGQEQRIQKYTGQIEEIDQRIAEQQEKLRAAEERMRRDRDSGDFDYWITFDGEYFEAPSRRDLADELFLTLGAYNHQIEVQVGILELVKARIIRKHFDDIDYPEQ